MNSVATVQPTILIIDDDVVVRITVQDYLEEAGFHVLEAADGKSGLEIVANEPVDLVLLDISLPDMDGFAVCRQLRATPAGKHLPILIVTGSDDADAVHQAFEVGATDFSSKPIHFELLVHRIRYILRASTIAEDLRSREASLADAQQRMLDLAYVDRITGLANRTLFDQHLRHAVVSAKRHERNLAVLFLDLDHFKRINDTWGHSAGDKVLREVAERLSESLRESDLATRLGNTQTTADERDYTIARLGGDEFVIVLPEIRRNEDAALVAERIISAMTEPFEVCSTEVYVGCSIGISLYSKEANSAEILLRQADGAMYQAKREGRNGYRFYTGELQSQTLARLKLEARLRHAVDREEFILHYQPRLDLNTSEVIGMEALVRWQCPGQGLIAPNEFISVAEETGLIITLGQWVLDQACKQARLFHQAGLSDLRVSVNVSMVQLCDPGLLDAIVDALQKHRLPANLLEIELTESALMGDVERNSKMLAELASLGVRISIDDFGTGYSSLNYLKRLPLDYLKIDRCFIKEMHRDSNDAAIVDAVVRLAHSLRLRVVAEGIDNADHEQLLREFGCDEVQGFLYAKPMPAESFHEWVLNHQNAVQLTHPALRAHAR